MKSLWMVWKNQSLRLRNNMQSMTEFLIVRKRTWMASLFKKWIAAVHSKKSKHRYLKKFFLRWKSATIGTQDAIALTRKYWTRWRSRHRREAFDTARKIVFAEAWFEKQLQRKVLHGWSKASGKNYIHR
jgi:hypothetical protein